MTMPLRFPLLAIACFAASAFAADTPAPTFPLWDGHESIEQYAKRTYLPPTKTLDLGNGVKLELVLIPAGTFIMGTPEPVPVDEDGFRKKIIVGQAAFAVGVGVLLVLIGTVIVRAVRQRHKPQYSLARLMAMTGVAGVAVMGGMHWWCSMKALAQAQAEHQDALARFKEADDYEKPAHEVTLTKPFYIGKHEVTVAQFRAFADVTKYQTEAEKGGVAWARKGGSFQECAGVSWRTPGFPQEDSHPACVITFNDAQEFCKWAAKQAGPRVRLPTEAQWECACRAGTTTRYNGGDEDSDLEQAAWFDSNSGTRTNACGQKRPNAWGLYDMHGNVWEWCQDWNGDYRSGAATDPQGLDNSPYRGLRGGSWVYLPRCCRSACRNWFDTHVRRTDGGFRVVAEASPNIPRAP